MKNTFSNKSQKIALVGCGYWGTIVAKTLISLKFNNIYIYDENYRNALTLKINFQILMFQKV